MNAKHLKTGICTLSLLIGAAGIGAWCLPQQPEDDDEVVIKLTEAPEAVRNAVGKLTPADKITKVTRESDGGLTVFEVEYTKEGATCSANLSSQGDVLEIEKSVAEAGVPAAAMAALKKKYPNASFKELTSVQKFYFEAGVVIDGKTHHVEVDATGKIEDEHHEEAKHEAGEKHEGKKGEKHERD